MPHALRLLECMRTLGAGGALRPSGPAAAFAAWVHTLTSRAATVAEVAPAILLAASRLRLPRSCRESTHLLPGVEPLVEWPWLPQGSGTAAPVARGVNSASAALPVMAPQSTATATATAMPVSSALAAITCMHVHDPAYSAAVGERTPQLELFTPVVRRDLYAVLINSHAPNSAGSRPMDGVGSIFSVALLGKASIAGGAVDTFAYVDRGAVGLHVAAGFVAFDDNVLLESIQQIGSTSPQGIAATLAFEHYLAATAKASWSSDTVKALSVEFLVAFAKELTPRLDISHRMRATKLSADEVRTLATPPYARFVDQGVLRTFQAMP